MKPPQPEAHLHATGTGAPALSVREKPILMSGEMVRAILDGRKTMTRRVCSGQRELSNEHDFQVDRCPYGAPGDRLWVRETYGDTSREDRHRPFSYRSDWSPEDDLNRDFKWKPGIFMPRRASRITLEIVSVRVERLQEITPDDARAEGGTPDCRHDHLTHDIACHIEAFERLWDSLEGKKPGCSWKDNPWVWKIEFRRAK